MMHFKMLLIICSINYECTNPDLQDNLTTVSDSMTGGEEVLVVRESKE